MRFGSACAGKTRAAILWHTYLDPDPLPVARVGVGGHDTRVNFSRIEIRALP